MITVYQSTMVPTDQVVNRFNHEFGYLSSSVHSTAPAGASAMSFQIKEFPASLKIWKFSVDNSKDIDYWGQIFIFRSKRLVL